MKPVTTARRVVHFAAGVFYLLVLAIFAWGATQQPFWKVLLATVLIMLACTGLAVGALARWAFRDDRRPGQFGIGSMLLGTVFFGVYLGVVRWLYVHQTSPPSGSSFGQFVIIAALCVLPAILSVPFMLLLADSLVWAAVWLVRRKAVQRWLFGRRE